MHHSFSEIIGLWPTQVSLAEEIEASPDRVRKWATRNSIPGEWFAAMVVAANRRGWTWVTADLLAQIAAKSRAQSAKLAPASERVCDQEHISDTIRTGDAA